MSETGAAAVAAASTTAATLPAAGATSTNAATTAATGAWAPPEAYKDIAGKYGNDPNKITEALANAQKFIGKDPATLLSIPKADDAEGQAALWNKLGRPEKFDGYKVPDALAKDPTLNAAREVAHANGLTQTQFEGLTKWFVDTGTAAEAAKVTAFNEKAAADMATLKNEWGQGYDRNVAAAKEVMNRLGLTVEELTQIESALGTRAFMEKFAKAGQGMLEMKATKGGENNDNAPMTPEQAKAELASLAKDKAFQAKYKAGDVTAKRRIAELTAYRTGMSPADFRGAIDSGQGGERIGRI